MPISNPPSSSIFNIASLQTDAPLCTPGGRLSLSGSNPVADVADVTILYYLPYTHAIVPLWNNESNVWEYRTIPDAGISINRVGDNPRNIDIYATVNDALPGGVGIDVQSWSSDTTRAIPRSRKNGIQVLTYNSGTQPIKTLLGTARMIGSNGSAKFHDTDGKRFLSNACNKVKKRVLMLDGNSSWNLTSSAWIPWNNNSVNRIEVVSCDGEPSIDLTQKMRANVTTSTYAGSGIGVDNTASPEVYSFSNIGDTSIVTRFVRPFGIGYHYFSALHASTSGTAVTVFGGVDSTLFGTWEC